VAKDDRFSGQISRINSIALVQIGGHESPVISDWNPDAIARTGPKNPDGAAMVNSRNRNKEKVISAGLRQEYRSSRARAFLLPACECAKVCILSTNNLHKNTRAHRGGEPHMHCPVVSSSSPI
jgi:hypothetical protein